MVLGLLIWQAEGDSLEETCGDEVGQIPVSGALQRTPVLSQRAEDTPVSMYFKGEQTLLNVRYYLGSLLPFVTVSVPLALKGLESYVAVGCPQKFLRTVEASEADPHPRTCHSPGLCLSYPTFSSNSASVSTGLTWSADLLTEVT